MKMANDIQLIIENIFKSDTEEERKKQYNQKWLELIKSSEKNKMK